jgi:hypothetical protein
MYYQSNDTILLELSADIVYVDDDFMTNLITANSACSLFVDKQRHVGKVIDWISHQPNYVPTIIGWLYPVRNKIYLYYCLLIVIIMLAIKIGNAWWQICETFSGGNIFISLNCKVLCSYYFIVCKCTKPIWQGSSSLYPLVLMNNLGK